MGTAIAYREPAILTILVQSSFLLVLNIINYLLDRAIYCGLVGQIFVGIASGTPGGKLLGEDAETVFTQLGYLGLILLVFEGGLATKIAATQANLFLSIGVALTGICLPVAFSFALSSLTGATPLQAFAAGAALCSTSLGTTFTVLSTSGLTKTRLGTVLTTAAMLDDVVGLVMVQVISNIGKDGNVSAITIVRPIAVSVGFVVIVILFCRLVAKRVLFWRIEKGFSLFFKGRDLALIVEACILIGMVAGASYAGTSNLFAAYLAGATISWWDDEVYHGLRRPSRMQKPTTAVKENERANSANGTQTTGPRATSLSQTGSHNVKKVDDSADRSDALESPKTSLAPVSDPSTSSGVAIYNSYYAPSVNRILKPFFFASIGFAIPITQMFNGAIVWRGLFYTLLMLLGKLITGLWLVRISTPVLGYPHQVFRVPFSSAHRLLYFCWSSKRGEQRTDKPPMGKAESKCRQKSTQAIPLSEPENVDANHPSLTSTAELPTPKPRSLYPPSILGLAMVARGEIGFLIASIAESEGIFSSSNEMNGESSDVFLIVVWAIMLCTILGPVGVGLLVKRVRALQAKRSSESRGEVLGAWGIG